MHVTQVHAKAVDAKMATQRLDDHMRSAFQRGGHSKRPVPSTRAGDAQIAVVLTADATRYTTSAETKARETIPGTTSWSPHSLHAAATVLAALAKDSEAPPAKRNRGNNHDTQPGGTDAASSIAPPVPMEPGCESNFKHALRSTDEVGVEESEATGNGALVADAMKPCDENGEVFAAIRDVPQKVEEKEEGEVEQSDTQMAQRVRQLLWLGIIRVVIQLVRETLCCNRKTARAQAVDLLSLQVNDITDDEKRLLADRKSVV